MSNRKLQTKVADALAWLAEGKPGPPPNTIKGPAKLLAEAAGFDASSGADPKMRAEFFSSIEVTDAHPGLRQAEETLSNDLGEYLPGTAGAEMRDLVERVARCATSLEDHRLLQRADVLLVLRTSADLIFPAPSLLEDTTHMVVTEAIATTASAVAGEPSSDESGNSTADVPRADDAVSATHPTTFLVMATSGTGKSVFSALLNSQVPSGSLTLTYDCFAAGDYRHATSLRHLSSVALTQLSNELAQAGLCSPLIPVAGIAEERFLRAFEPRVRRAATIVAARQPGALLCIVVDAGDNAAMTAKARGHGTFVDDVLNAVWPSNVRVVVTCRPERADHLQVPRSVHRLNLRAFTVAETTAHLRATFPDASDADGRELHELSSQGNPRVLQMALANAESVEEPLVRLRIAAADGSTGTDATLNSLLRQQTNVMVDHHELTTDHLNRLGRAVGILPPAIPLDVLAQVADLEADAIRSFAASLGRGVHTSASTFQFRDEPTETWFRQTFRPSPQELAAIIDDLKVVASSSAYAAQTLPQLMLEANLHDDLITLALSDDHLPTSLPGQASASPRAKDRPDLQAHHIARSRAKYALAALLRMGRLGDAALLAVRAGRLSGGHNRRMTMFRSNPDLTSKFVEAEVVAEMCASKAFTSDFVGSHLHIEAAVLSGNPDTHELARSRTRTAVENFVAVTSPLQGHDRARLNYDDAGALAWAYLNVDGAQATVDYMRRWPTGRFRQGIARSLFAQLADAGRFDDISTIALTRGSGLRVQVAAAEVLYDYGRPLHDDLSRKLARNLEARRKTLLVKNDPKSNGRGVAWALVHALNLDATSEQHALRILDLHHPATLSFAAGPDGGQSDQIVGALMGHALRAYLRGEPFAFDTVAPPVVLERLSKGRGREAHANTYQDFVTPLLTWVWHLLEAHLHTARIGVGPTAASATRRTTSPAAGGVAEVRLTLSELMARLPGVNGRVAGESRWQDGKSAWHGPLAEAVTRILVAYQTADATAPSADDASAGVDEARETFSAWYESFSAGSAHRLGSHVRVARIAGRHQPLAALGLSAIVYAADAAMMDRTSSETRVESLVRVARAALALDENEARALFTQAIEQADLVGDDLYARMNALLQTATAIPAGSPLAAGDTPDDARAHRLFQIAETLHHEGEDIGLSMLGARMWRLGEATTLGLASRARDRRTLGVSELTEAPFHAGLIAPHKRSLLAFAAFRPGTAWRDSAPATHQWPALSDTDDTEVTGTNATSGASRRAPSGWDEQQWRHAVKTLDHFERNDRHYVSRDIDPICWSDRLDASAGTSGAATTDAAPPGSSSAGSDHATKAAISPALTYFDDEDGTVDIAALCASLDFTSPASWDQVFAHPWRHDRPDAATGIAFDQHRTKRPQLLKALAEAPSARVDDFVRAAETAAGVSPQTPALLIARKELAVSFGSRFAMRLCTSHYWDSSVTALAAACGVDSLDIMRAAVGELSGVAHDLEYGDYFGLAATLATMLNNDLPVAPPNSSRPGLTGALRPVAETSGASTATTAPVPAPGDIFDALAELFDDLSPPHSAPDGPYTAVALTSEGSSTSGDEAAGVPQALAAFVWSALGDPEAAVRWQAVHAVVLLAQLGCGDELDTIADLAAGRVSAVASFTDARFTFHDLHAHMWLLFALQRLSHDAVYAKACAPFVPWLVETALGPPHAVNQHLAHTVIAAMVDQGLIISDAAGSCTVGEPEAEPDRTDTVAGAAFQKAYSATATVVTATDLAALAQVRVRPPTARVEWRNRDTVPRALPSPSEGHERISVDWDFDQYWCEQITRLFPVNADAVLWRINQIMRTAHGEDAIESHDDPRREANVYDNRRAYLDHSAWPDMDNLRFYRAFHALMQVAAELRATVDVFHGEWGEEDNEDEWAQWLSRYLPHRSDGRMLADRRDPPPSPSPIAHVPEDADTHWTWSLCPEAFADALGAASTSTVVWESSTAATSTNEEERAIRTALVPHVTAPALVTAMQTNSFGFRATSLPAEGDRHHGSDDLLTVDDVACEDSPAPDQPDSSEGCGGMAADNEGLSDPTQQWCSGWQSELGPFRLTPWMRSLEREVAIEAFDARGKSVAFPPPGPARRVIDAFHLTSDPDQRTWSYQGRPVIWTTMWQNMTAYGSDQEVGTHGIRVEIDNDFLSTVLTHFDLTLIAEVGMRRTRYRHYSQRNKDDELDSLEWSAKIYLVNPDGSWSDY